MGVIKEFYKTLSLLTYPFAKKRIENFNVKENSIWFHAASLGEIASIKPIIEKMIERKKNFFITTMTESGKKKAEREFKEDVYLFPYDNPLLIKKLIEKAKLVIFAESEFWPNTLTEIERKKKKLILVNGRISEKSFKKWKAFRGTFSLLLSAFDRFFVIDENGKKILKFFGVNEEKISISGNLKFLGLNKIIEPLFKKPFDLTITIASLRSKEFKGGVNFIENILRDFKNLGFIIAVRHLNTLLILESLLRSKKIVFEKFSENKGKMEKGSKILILDTLGDLIKVFPISDAVVVGGTFAPYGGHNLLEPAQFGVPVFFGPFTENVKSMEEILLKEKGGIRVKNWEELYKVMKEKIKEGNLESWGKNAKKAVIKAKKIAEKGLSEIIKYIDRNL